MMFDACSLGPRRRGPQSEHVVVLCGGEILTGYFRDHQEQALLLQLPVTPAGSTQEFDSSDFKVIDVVGVVQSPLSIGFLVTNADLNLMAGGDFRCVHIVGWRLASLNAVSGRLSDD